jgi:hypothetical protein
LPDGSITFPKKEEYLVYLSIEKFLKESLLNNILKWNGKILFKFWLRRKEMKEMISY